MIKTSATKNINYWCWICGHSVCMFFKKYHVDILDIDQEKLSFINKGRIFSNDSELLKQFGWKREYFGISY